MKKVLACLVLLSAVAMAEGEKQNTLKMQVKAGGDFLGNFTKLPNGLNNGKTSGNGYHVALNVLYDTNDFSYAERNGIIKSEWGFGFSVHQLPNQEEINGKRVGTYTSAPAYFIVKSYFNPNGEIKPFLEFDLGYYYSYQNNNEGNTNPATENYAYDGGAYLSVGFGIEYKNFSLDMSYAYTENFLKQKGENIGSKVNYTSGVVALGYKFNLVSY
ncbi:MAG: hypothetical protein ACRCSK_00415 [Fusobacteriaceae bacterium]